MGIDPAKIEYLTMAADRGLGVIEEAQVEQRGETIKAVATKFDLIPDFKTIRLAS
jgi:hypothetical protein